MLTGSWSRKVRFCTPRMKVKASIFLGRSMSLNLTGLLSSSKSYNSKFWKSLTRI